MKIGKNTAVDLNAIIQDCLNFVASFQAEEARGKIIEYFGKKERETLEATENSLHLIRITIDELKARRSQACDNAACAPERTRALTRLLYEIAISQSTGEAEVGLIRELTFYLLVAGDQLNFIRRSETLLDSLRQDDLEYRANVFAIGCAQLFIHQPSTAKNTFERLLAAHPDASEAHFGLALTYLKLGDTSHFTRALQLTLELAPELGQIVERLSSLKEFTIADYSREMEALEEQSV